MEPAIVDFNIILEHDIAKIIWSVLALDLTNLQSNRHLLLILRTKAQWMLQLQEFIQVLSRRS